VPDSNVEMKHRIVVLCKPTDIKHTGVFQQSKLISMSSQYSLL